MTPDWWAAVNIHIHNSWPACMLVGQYPNMQATVHRFVDQCQNPLRQNSGGVDSIECLCVAQSFDVTELRCYEGCISL